MILMIKGFLAAVGMLALAGTVGADMKACREAMENKRWDQAFEPCHAEAVEADKGEGDTAAMMAVAVLHLKGQGTGRDVNEGMRWMRKAADRGAAPAMLFIGLLYAEGESGVTRDKEAALRWFRKAAEMGNQGGQFLYGSHLLQRGHDQRAPDDLVTGYMYLMLSKDERKGSKEHVQGYSLAADHAMRSAEKHLTDSQIDEARRRARKWTKAAP